MAHLILVRYGKSAWNHLGKWTGLTDVDLVEEGKEEARRTGSTLKGIPLHIAHVSLLKRTRQTLEEIKHALGNEDLQTLEHQALNERDYGIHTGKNKWEVQKEVGDEEFQKIRRGWDTLIPEGETLKDVHSRVVPYFEEYIKPDLLLGKNVLIVAHGNSLRALVKHLENLSDTAICEVEIGTGEAHCYTMDEKGSVTGKEIRGANSKPKV